MRISDWSSDVCSSDLIGGMPVRTNVSAFLAKYKDIQRTTSLIFEGLVVTGNFNAAAATLYGTQVDVLLRPLPGFDLQGSYGYLHTKYDSFDNPILGNLTGNKFAQAPEHTVHRTEEHTSELQSLMRTSSAASCLTEKI